MKVAMQIKHCIALLISYIVYRTVNSWKAVCDWIWLLFLPDYTFWNDPNNGGEEKSILAWRQRKLFLCKCASNFSGEFKRKSFCVEFARQEPLLENLEVSELFIDEDVFFPKSLNLPRTSSAGSPEARPAENWLKSLELFVQRGNSKHLQIPSRTEKPLMWCSLHHLCLIISW